MTALITCSVIFILLTALPYTQGTVCSYSCSVSGTTACGWFGWGRCSRTRLSTCYRCCTGWSGTISSGCDIAVCSTPCTNGGKCTAPNSCTGCNRGYYSPRCNRCSSITHCNDVYCSTSSNQLCGDCEGDYGSTRGSAYIVSSDRRRCIRQCSWRTGSNACYPGSCTNGLCTCSSGFSGGDCRTMSTSQRPGISEYRATLMKEGETLESPAAPGSTTAVYTDVTDFTSIRVVWKSSYQPVGLPNIHAGDHPYIHSVSLGVVSARVTVSVRLARGGTQQIGTQMCSSSGSRSNPATNTVVCEVTFNIDYSSWTPGTGDVLAYTVESSSGGYMKLFDRDNSDNIITRYYTVSTNSVGSTFTYALDGPSHCVGTDSCRSTMLDAGDDVTSQPVVSVTWQGWTDQHSGIKEYHLEVRQLSGTDGDEMTEVLDGPAVYEVVTGTGWTITLPHIAVYSMVLSVVDNVDNVRRSRRFVFFDDDKDDVTIKSNFPMRVLSASEETNYTWQTNVDPLWRLAVLLLNWQGHFVNEIHDSRGLLKPIGPYQKGIIDADYDQNFGQRGRAEVINAMGVTQFCITYNMDHSGGRTIVDMSNDNSDCLLGSTTQHYILLVVADGDSIRFWVEARDIAGHSARDDVLVHIDSSPPVIEDLKMVIDLYGRSIKFRTFDPHSGIRTIEWRLLDNTNNTVLYSGSETVLFINTTDQMGEDCDPAICVCVPVGDCYVVAYSFTLISSAGVSVSKFLVELTVTNNAGLVTSETIEPTVTADNVGEIAASLVSITNDTSSINGKVVVSAADILESIVDINDTSPEITEKVVTIVSNLLQVDDKQFGESDKVANSSSRIVQSLDKHISHVLAAGQNVSQVTSSLAVVAKNFHPRSLADGLGFAAVEGENGTDLLSPDQIDIYGPEDSIPVEEVAASIKLPARIAENFPEGSPIPVSFVIYKNSNLFRSQKSNSTPSSNLPSFVDSLVISGTVEGARIENLPEDAPVVTTFLTDQAKINRRPDQEAPQCVYWDFSLRGGIGEWSSKGCTKTNPIGGRTVCHCSHTTNFAVLVNIHGPKYPDFALDVFSKIGCGVSTVALIMTIAFYVVIRPLRMLEASRILVSFCCSLLLLYIVFLAGIEQTSSRVGCIIAAVLIHYFALTSIAWMGVEAANLYLKLVRVFNADVDHLMIKASITAWGLPMLVVAITLAVDYTVYENKDSCFLKPGVAFYFAELLVVGLVLLFNFIIFVLVLRKLTHSSNEGASDDKRSIIARRLKIMFAVSLLLGLTWTFGLLSVFESSSFVFQFLFCVFNSLQGLFIFVVFVMMQDTVREYVSSLFSGGSKERATSSSGLASSSRWGGPFIIFKRNSANKDNPDTTDGDSALKPSAHVYDIAAGPSHPPAALKLRLPDRGDNQKLKQPTAPKPLPQVYGNAKMSPGAPIALKPRLPDRDDYQKPKRTTAPKPLPQVYGNAKMSPGPPIALKPCLSDRDDYQKPKRTTAPKPSLHVYEDAF